MVAAVGAVPEPELSVVVCSPALEVVLLCQHTGMVAAELDDARLRKRREALGRECGDEVLVRRVRQVVRAHLALRLPAMTRVAQPELAVRVRAPAHNALGVWLIEGGHNRAVEVLARRELVRRPTQCDRAQLVELRGRVSVFRVAHAQLPVVVAAPARHRRLVSEHTCVVPACSDIHHTHVRRQRLELRLAVDRRVSARAQPSWDAVVPGARNLARLRHGTNMLEAGVDGLDHLVLDVVGDAVSEILHLPAGAVARVLVPVVEERAIGCDVAAKAREVA
mmetsp:Transcript_11720/g.30560  ORF Transcript_11720/g.30560 Transcript_11720/m.30560 type:complete len:279 (-) Transcript_11720:873-1709(-)